MVKSYSVVVVLIAIIAVLSEALHSDSDEKRSKIEKERMTMRSLQVERIRRRLQRQISHSAGSPDFPNTRRKERRHRHNHPLDLATTQSIPANGLPQVINESTLPQFSQLLAKANLRDGSQFDLGEGRIVTVRRKQHVHGRNRTSQKGSRSKNRKTSLSREQWRGRVR